MEEKQVNKVFLSTDFKPVLTSDKGKGATHLCEEATEILNQRLLQLSLAMRIT